MTRTRSFIAWALLLLALYSVGLAIGPRVPPDQLRAPSTDGGPPNCLTAIDLPGPFGLLLNCDSPGFLEAAAKPSALSEPGNWRQSRPGQIWAVWAIAQPIKLFTSAMVAFVDRGDVGIPQGATRSRAQAIADMGPGFVAFYVFNVGMLLASVWLLRRTAFALSGGLLVATLVGSSLLFNDITKTYLLTPHSQLMNILLPMVMVALVVRCLRGEVMRVGNWALLGLLCGAGLLAYATWVLVPVVVVCALALSVLTGGGDRAVILRTARWAPLSFVLLFLPYAIWYAFVVHHAGSFYVHETNYDGGLTWLWRKPPVEAAVQLVGNAAYLLWAAVKLCWPYAVFLLPPGLLVISRGWRLEPEQRRQLVLSMTAAALVSLLFLVFFSLLGFRLWRYAVPLLPAWTLPLALLNQSALQSLAPGPARRRYLAVMAVLAVGIAIGEVAKGGPWG